MNLTQLRLFRDVAREQSFGKAAQKNFISQPAVSVHIRKLEEELGKKLLNRSPHQIELTPDGITALADVKEILRLCDGLRIRSRFSQGILEGNIRIASIHSIGMYEMGDFLAAFMKSFPKVHIHLQYQRFDEIYDLLLKEKIDLGLVAYPERRTRIETIPYGSDDLVLIVGGHHPLAGGKSVVLEQIKEEPFIAFDQGIPTREATDRFFQEKGISLDLRMTNDNIFTLKKAVEAGIGVSIVPSDAVEEEIRQGRLSRLKIRDIDSRRPLALLKLKKCQLSKPAEVFVERLLERE